MPTVKKRGPVRKDSQTLTDDQLVELVCGPGFLSGLDGFKNEAQRKRAWETFRRRIMARKIENPYQDTFTYYQPDCRPWAWFAYEHGIREPGSFREQATWLQENGFIS